ncbi:hypothetical protein AYR66_07770 [Noviherbaspirillum denitrificans]|uniref:MEDS domain-containing protein n=1 Tax=Noviherbaspirillum denitrificans TaxID=1968433 RepID=A0A254T9U6_9BURK|nr:hypothetical protein AYR66_07770 [Noviherbaspirillum denitrificans]
MPDDRRFHEHAGGLIERASRRFGNVRVFTELPGILWESGNRLASVRLEALWNTLRTHLPFALLCSYRVDGEDPHPRQVCGAHSHLLPMG